VNARLKPIDIERQTLHDQLQIAHEKLDAARKAGDPDEYGHQLSRVKAIKFELFGSTIRNTTVSREEWEQPDREEQREGATNGAVDWSRA